MTDNDREALRRAMLMAQEEADYAAYLAAKLKLVPWTDVAPGAAYHCQIQTLHLEPWRQPPLFANENSETPRDPDAQRLLRRMLAAGLSRYEPDPLAALEEKEKRRAVTPDDTIARAARHLPPEWRDH